jgi:uncharacterized protein YqeY
MREAIAEAIKTAMKAGDKLKVTTLRTVSAKIKEADLAVQPGRERISDAEVTELLAKLIKQRRESIEAFTKGGRPELAKQEADEIAIIQAFLPQQMSDAEAKAAVEAVVKELAASSVKDMGKVMATLKVRYAGRMDFGKASGLVKAMLG